MDIPYVILLCISSIGISYVVINMRILKDDVSEIKRVVSSLHTRCTNLEQIVFRPTPAVDSNPPAFMPDPDEALKLQRMMAAVGGGGNDVDQLVKNLSKAFAPGNGVKL